MKKLSLAILSALLLATRLFVHGQSFTVDWFTINGGGSTSTNAAYSVRGTIGQCQSGVMNGASYTVQGGFWAIVAVQSPGVPWLTISPTLTNSVIISWPQPSTDFQLQENTSLSGANWTDVESAVTTIGGVSQVIVRSLAGNRFYRLRKVQP